MFAVILEELQQTDLNQRISGVFTDIGNAENINFDINFIEVDRDQLSESFLTCKKLFLIANAIFK